MTILRTGTYKTYKMYRKTCLSLLRQDNTIYHGGLKSILHIKYFPSYVFKWIYDFKSLGLGAGYWKLSIHDALHTFLIYPLLEDFQHCNFPVHVHRWKFSATTYKFIFPLYILQQQMTGISYLPTSVPPFSNFCVNYVVAGRSEVRNKMDGKWLTYLFTNPGATLRNCSTPCWICINAPKACGFDIRLWTSGFCNCCRKLGNINLICSWKIIHDSISQTGELY